MYYIQASQVALVVKNLPANASNIRNASREDLLEEGMVTHSSILAWKIQWTEEPSRLQSHESTKSDTTEQLSMYTHISGLYL